MRRSFQNRYGVVPFAQSRPAPRRSPVAVLTASALLMAGVAFAASPLPTEIGLVRESCTEGKAMRQLDAARETRTQTRALLAGLAVSTDPQHQDLARELAGLGFTPATQPAGWRQKAVDVSDRLNGTTDPQLREVSVRLAKAGFGPTPADLLPRESGSDAGPPIDAIGDTLRGAGDSAAGVVESAGTAVQQVTAPASSGESSTRGPAAVNPDRRAEPPLPPTCLDEQPAATVAPAASAPAAAPAAPAPVAAPPPDAAEEPSQPAEPGGDDEPADDATAEQPGRDDGAGSDPGADEGTAAGDDGDGDALGDSEEADSSVSRDSGSTGGDTPASGGDADRTTRSGSDDEQPAGDDTSQTPDSASSTREEDSTSPRRDSSSADSNSAEPSSADVEKARAAIELLGELMQALGASPDTEAGHLQISVMEVLDRDQLAELGADPTALDQLDELVDSGDAGSGSGDPSTADGPGADRSSRSDDTSDGDRDSDSASDEPAGSSGDPEDTASDRSGPSLTPDTGGDVDSMLDSLTEQVSEAADTDPVAEQIADKLAAIDREDSGGDDPTAPDSEGPGENPRVDRSDRSATDQDDDQDSSRETPEADSGDDSGDESGAGSAADEQTGSNEPISRGGGGEGDRPSVDRDGGGAADSGGSVPSGGDRSAGEDADTAPAAGGDGPVEQAPPAPEPAAEEEGEQPRDPEPAPTAPPAEDPAAGADTATWDRLAECESGGDWGIDTNNGYSGGLQFAPATWAAFGGQGEAHEASREEQIAVAERVQAEQGWQAWPACSAELGLR